MTIKEKYKIQSIKPSLFKEWFFKKHYAKTMPSIEHCFGLFEDKELKGICSYGNGARFLQGSIVSKYKDIKHYELNRLIAECLEKNALSYFVSSTIKLLPKPSILVSYADKNQKHHGYIYQATNWLFTGETTKKYYYYDTVRKKRLHSHTINSIFGTEKIEFLPSYITRVNEEYGKYRYVYFNGNKKFIKDCKDNLNYEVKKYPKGKNEYYDASYKCEQQLGLF